MYDLCLDSPGRTLVDASGNVRVSRKHMHHAGLAYEHCGPVMLACVQHAASQAGADPCKAISHGAAERHGRCTDDAEVENVRKDSDFTLHLDGVDLLLPVAPSLSIMLEAYPQMSGLHITQSTIDMMAADAILDGLKQQYAQGTGRRAGACAANSTTTTTTSSSSSSCSGAMSASQPGVGVIDLLFNRITMSDACWRLAGEHLAAGCNLVQLR
jgi:hypothetical protein